MEKLLIMSNLSICHYEFKSLLQRRQKVSNTRERVLCGERYIPIVGSWYSVNLWLTNCITKAESKQNKLFTLYYIQEILSRRLRQHIENQSKKMNLQLLNEVEDKDFKKLHGVDGWKCISMWEKDNLQKNHISTFLCELV